MQPFRFLLYCLSAVAGFAGLVVGGSPVIGYVYQRSFGGSYSINSDELFRDTVIFFLSLILLMTVHIGHRLAKAFDISLPKKPAADVSTKPEVR